MKRRFPELTASFCLLCAHLHKQFTQMKMKRLFSPIHSKCWVYITYDPGSNSRQIKYTVDLNSKLHDIQDATLIYYRSFDNVMDALGHKLLLENLSTQSIDCIIRKTNPQMQDLKLL